jgi:hypothetical protein
LNNTKKIIKSCNWGRSGPGRVGVRSGPRSTVWSGPVHGSARDGSTRFIFGWRENRTKARYGTVHGPIRNGLDHPVHFNSLRDRHNLNRYKYLFVVRTKQVICLVTVKYVSRNLSTIHHAIVRALEDGVELWVI